MLSAAVLPPEKQLQRACPFGYLTHSHLQEGLNILTAAKETELLNTERLPAWLSSVPLQETWSHLILAKFLTLQNMSELKPSFQNEGNSPFNNPFSR